jgi:hypothetical protein
VTDLFVNFMTFAPLWLVIAAVWLVAMGAIIAIAAWAYTTMVVVQETYLETLEDASRR